MTAATNWALGIGVAVVAAALGGAITWQHRHPDASPVASLRNALPDLPTLGTAPPPKATQAPPTQAPQTQAPQTQAPQTQAPQTADRGPEPPPAPKPAPLATEPPHFDVVRVEPKGDTVVAGKGAPNAKVALVASGKVVAETTADASGQFVLIPPPLAPGDYDLTLRQTPDGKPSADSSQNVVVSVPQAGKGQVVVALAEPGKPTKVLTPPPAQVATASPTSPAPRPPPQKLGIRSVDLENGTGFHAVGEAPPGTPVHVYLNNSHLADVVAGPDGQWSVTIRKGLAGGAYIVRADAGDGKAVVARAEVPFDVPLAMAQPATMVSPADSRPVPPSAGGQEAQAPSGAPNGAPADAPAEPGKAVIDEVQTRQVVVGDSLWAISQQRLGIGTRYTQIYAANASQIRDPNLIYPGQIFVLPQK